jgi:hypothetical protein
MANSWPVYIHVGVTIAGDGEEDLFNRTGSARFGGEFLMAWGFESTLRNALTQHRSLRVSRRSDMIHANDMIDA